MTEVTTHDGGGQIESDTARALSDRGLVGPAFDLEAVVADIRSRLEADASLDDLIGEGEPA